MSSDGILQVGKKYNYCFENQGRDVFVFCDNWVNKPHEEAEVRVVCHKREDGTVNACADAFAMTYDDDFGDIPQGIPIEAIQDDVRVFVQSLEWK